MVCLPRGEQMLTYRIVSALVLVLVVVPGIWVGGPTFALLVLALCVLGVVELARMLSRREIHVAVPVAVLSSVLIVAFAYSGNLSAVITALGISTLMSLAYPVFSGNRLNHIDVTATVYAIMYVPFLFSHLLLLRNRSVWLLAIAVGCTWACDVFAYFVGMAMGRSKIAPSISPRKSWEGAAGGFLASCLTAAVLSWYSGTGAVNGAIFGALLGVSGQVGDLAESALKRYTGVKDSGTLIPGHGGVLDRFDSLLFNAAVLYHLITFMRM